MNAAFATPRAWATTYLGARGITVKRPAARPLRMSSPFILEHVAIYFGVDSEALLVSRRGELPRIRQVGMFLACELTTESLPQIARTFKKADHTTVMNGRNRITSLMPHDSRLASDVAALRGLLAESFAAYAKAVVTS